MGRYKHYEMDNICNKWQISKVTIWSIKKRLLKEFGFCEYKHIEIFLEDRLNIKKLAQDLLIDKTAKDIEEFFRCYQDAYIFIQNIFSISLTIRDSQYNKCMMIINKFDKKQ